MANSGNKGVENMQKRMSCTELKQRLDSGERLVLVDVLPPECYEGKHLPGASNACVYEMAFPERMADLAPDREVALVVYTNSDRSRAADCARDKLIGAGYRSVVSLDGGIEAWEASGFSVEPLGGCYPAEPSLQDRTYRLDPTHCTVTWAGRNLNGRHDGIIPLVGGQIAIAAGRLVGGEIVLDLTKLANRDLQDETLRALLETHLKSDDFFDVARYPNATVRLLGGEPLAGATPGTANYRVLAELTLKGVTRPLSFAAAVAPQQDGSVKAQAALELDRTDWGILYGSGKLFERLGMHLVHDQISVELFLTVLPA